MNKRLSLKNKLLIAAALLFAGCATSYSQEGIFTNGYTSKRIGPDTFVVTFRANEFTPSDKVRDYALRRAAEVAAKHGFDSYVILEEENSAKRATSGSRHPYPSIRLVIQGIHAN
jgi:hypothetical protein